MALSNLGGLYSFMGDINRSIDYYKQALNVNKALYKDKDHIDIVVSSLNSMKIEFEFLF